MAELPRLSSGFQARYRLVRELGEGGMGRVFEATQLNLNRRVALKLLKAESFGDTESRRRFVSEGQLLAKIGHGNVVALFDADFDDRLPYLVMEFVEGPTLGQVVRDRRGLSLDDALAVSAGLLDGLAHMHQHGILHRDLKAENVLLEGGTRPMLADFGLARLEGSGRLTRDGTVMGTPLYMAPEQMRGAEGDRTSDLYAFGVLLFHMLTASYPIPSASGWKSLNLKLELNRAAIARQLRGVPPAIVDALARCLAVHPDERFESAEQLLDALGVPAGSGKALPIPAVVPPRAGVGPRTIRMLQQRVRLFLSAAAFFASLSVAGLWWQRWHPGPPAGPEIVGQPTVERLPGASRVRWRTRSPAPSLVSAGGRVHGSQDAVVDHVVDVAPVAWASPTPAALVAPGEGDGVELALVASPVSVRPEAVRSGSEVAFMVELPETVPLSLEIRGPGTIAGRWELPAARVHAKRLPLPDAEKDYELSIASPGGRLLPARWPSVPLPSPRREVTVLLDALVASHLVEKLAPLTRDALDVRPNKETLGRRLEGIVAAGRLRERLFAARGGLGWALAPGAPGGRPLASAVLSGLSPLMQLDQLSRMAGLGVDSGVRDRIPEGWRASIGKPPSSRRSMVYLPKQPIRISGFLTSGIRSYFLDENTPIQSEVVLELPRDFSAKSAWITLEIRSAVPYGIALVDLRPSPESAVTLEFPLDGVDRTAPRTPVTHALDPVFLTPGPNALRLRFATLPGTVATTIAILAVTITWS